MPDIDAVADTIAAARTAVAADVARVAAAIDTALGVIDNQLSSLHERREQLEAALAAVNDQIAAVDGQREALIAARATAPRDEAAPAEAEAVDGQGPGEVEEFDGDEDGESYLEFTEEELDPQIPRTERIVTVLNRAMYDMKAGDIAHILNEFGDDTTAKVVGGTLSSLARRGAVTKAGAGAYRAA